jgi:16S rRNA C967 or C1407 C5-methylase (RsmB/RsmF family)
MDVTGSAQIETVAPFLDHSGFMRTAPHLHGLDGFFAARLKRLR